MLILLQVGTGYAQYLDQGAITGIVKDQTGSVVPGAIVLLENTDTNRMLQQKSGNDGEYTFSPIPIGHYEITVKAHGFATTRQEHLTLNLSQRLSVAITLYPGSVTQTVVVHSAPPLLETQGSSVDQVIDTAQINDTPLNGRNWVFMAQLIPGTTPATSRARGSGDFNANGLRPEQNDFVLDGMDNMAITVDYLGGSSFLVNPPPDALSEFKVSTADYSAEFGHSAGAVVDASIKSGTNHVHGDLWEYWRNDALDAKDFNAQSIPAFRENLFGATLGFPVLRNHLFFFGDVQETRIAAQQPYTQNVPTALERQGNFTELLEPALTGEAKPITLYEPGNGMQLMKCMGQQNVLCGEQIDPVAEKILNLYPAPNANGKKTYSNNVQNLNQPQNTFQYDARVDWNISSRDSTFVRFSNFNQMGNYEGSLGPILDGSGGEGSQNVSGLQLDFGNNFVWSETHIFSPTFVNEFRFGYDYGHFDTYQLNFTQNIAQQLGMNGMPFGAIAKDNGGLPTLSIGGIASAGTHAYRPEEESENEYQILDNVTKSFGKQSLRFGFSAQSVRSSTLEPPASHGQYSFSGYYTGSYGTPFTGDGIADFLTDMMNSGSIGPSSSFNDYNWYLAGYTQDDWRVTNKLTLNLGIRYDWFGPYSEMQNRQANFYPNGLPGITTGSGVLLYPNQSQHNLHLSTQFLQNLAADNIQIQYVSDRALTQESKSNVGPRIGFAYAIDPQTVFHGGFGLFYQGQQNAGAAYNMGTNYPFVFSDNFTSPSCRKNQICSADGYTLETGFAEAIQQGLSSYVSNPTLIGQSPHMKTTYVMDYNFTVQKSITPNMIFSLAYVGDASRHLPYNENPNSTAVLLPSGLNLQNYLPFPKFGNMNYINYEGISSYNSLQVKVQKRMSSGLQFLASYTWGHALDDAAEPLGGGIGGYRDENIIPIRDDYTNSGWDERQRFTLTGFYRLPFGENTPHPFDSKLANESLGGWATDITFQAQTGQPFSVSPADTALAVGGTKYAIAVRDPFAPGGTPDPSNPDITCPSKVRTLTHWYNPCAFRNPLPVSMISPGPYQGSSYVPQPGYPYPEYVTGIKNALAFLGGRSNQMYGPGMNRTDVSVFKNFSTYRDQYLQLRVDGFNVTNTAEWGRPSTSSDGQSGGLITGPRYGQVYTPNARCLQISGKYVF